MKLPVLLLAYNRPEETIKILKYLLKLKIKKIFISIDGPKKNLEDYEKSNELIKKIKQFQIKTSRINILKKNYGCKTAVEKGINWFFSHVDKGIILEDDCIPNKSFFIFCEKMLLRYKNTKVKVVSGNNFLQNQIKISDHYYFSKFNHCWGWATWRSAWAQYDGSLKNWKKFKESKKWKNFFLNKVDRKYWEKIFDLCLKNHFDSWAYPWLYSIWYNNGYTIIPKYNLVNNVGAIGTHNSFNSNFKFLAKNLRHNFKHPKKIKFNDIADDFVMRNFFKPENFLWPTRMIYLMKRFVLNPIFFIKILIKKIKKNKNVLY